MERISKDSDDGITIEMPNGVRLCVMDMMTGDGGLYSRDLLIRAAEMGYKAALEKSE